MAHTDLGRQMLMRLQNDLAAYASVEQHPLMEGRQMIMMLAPKKK
jgi:translation initiation factor IF-3